MQAELHKSLEASDSLNRELVEKLKPAGESAWTASTRRCSKPSGA